MHITQELKPEGLHCYKLYFLGNPKPTLSWSWSFSRKRMGFLIHHFGVAPNFSIVLGWNESDRFYFKILSNLGRAIMVEIARLRALDDTQKFRAFLRLGGFKRQCGTWA